MKHYNLPAIQTAGDNNYNCTMTCMNRPIRLTKYYNLIGQLEGNILPDPIIILPYGYCMVLISSIYKLFTFTLQACTIK